MDDKQKELNKQFRKYKITAKQWGGDDGYQWAIFIDGREFVNGLTRYEVPYYKKRALDKALGVNQYNEIPPQ